MNSSAILLRRATQTRLCAVFNDKDKLHPIKGLPVYAEVIATIIILPARVEINENWISKVLSESKFSIEQQQLIKDVLIKYLSEHFGQPSSEEMGKIIEASMNELSKQKDRLLRDFSEAKVESIIAFVINSLIKEGTIKPPRLDEKTEPLKQYIPFGYLATDHAGYISFDIENAIKRFLDIDKELRVDFEYWMYPNGDMDAGINVSALGRVTANYIYGNITLTKPVKQHINGTSYHSLQNPGLTDWYLSPGSFSVNPTFFIGEDGCEQLYPANFATSEFRFFQIVRGDEVSQNPAIRKGFAFEYNTLWQPLGHTLGQVIYSLPLAPGEVVKIGIIDWKRKSEDSRQEDTTESEDLTHDTFRDRTISETVQGALKEWQRGGSVMGGNSGGAGASFGMGMFGAAAGNAHSFGGGYSTSSGDRDFTASTVQQVNDAFSQHSTAIRELRSTVVVQSNQQEYARAETRVIANNNHSHALTMLYYEVLRHYKVTTHFVLRRKVLLIDYSSQRINYFGEDIIYKYINVFEKVLLDNRFSETFKLIPKFLFYKQEFSQYSQQKPQAEYTFKEFQIRFNTGNDPTNSNVYVLIEKKNADRVFTKFNRSDDSVDDPEALDRIGYDDFGANDNDTYLLYVNEEIKWGDINAIFINLVGGDNWRLKHVTVTGISSDGFFILVDTDRDDLLSNSGLLIPITPPQPAVPIPSLNDKFNEDENIKLFEIKQHFNNNNQYYNTAIWLNEDPNDRAMRFEDIHVDNRKLIDQIENRPIDVLGNFVVFPSNYPKEDSIETYKGKTEKLMTLPTRGVFGEAKLGHCNASEVIDNTRFWDWQQSPIQEKAPDIDPISTESRNVTQNLTPTPFPSSIVNIVNPTPAPDPTAMAGALNLLGKSDIFRDMSMSKEVNDLLKKLSDNAVEMADAANQARGILQKQDNGGNNNSSSGNAGNLGNSNQNTPTNTNTIPTKEENESKEVDNSQKKLEVAKQGLTPKQQQQVREKVTKDLTTENKYIHIELQTADRGGIIDVMEPADYDINQQYQGKLQFVGGTATVTTKNQNGSFHIKLKGKVPNIPGREYFSQIPGYENQSGEYYFESSCFFKFSNEETSVLLHGELTVKTSEAVVNVDVNGKLSLDGGAGFSLPIKVVKLDLTSKVQVDIGGQVGYKITYKIDSITGLSLKQM